MNVYVTLFKADKSVGVRVMGNNAKFLKRYKKLMILMLAVIIIGLIGCSVHVYLFNHRERLYTPAGPTDDCSMEIAPRGDESSQWVKNVIGMPTWYATIYQGLFTNASPYTITYWSMRVNIHEACCVSNAWCGSLEIHQNTEEGEKVQTLDLRNFSPKDLTLDYIQDGPDTMILLNDGDYIEYLPGAADKEYPITGRPKSDDESSARTIGLIFYSHHSAPMVFDDFEITYYLHKGLAQMPVFWFFSAAAILWVMLVIAYIAVFLTDRAAQKRIRQDELIIEQSIHVLTKFVDAKDSYTNGHSYRVAEYSQMLGQKLGFSTDECRQLFYIALMHDCGKVAIPDAILKKPGRLTDEEYAAIKKHTTVGAELLNDFTSIKGIRDGALYHHERYDGTGYPTGKSGEDIPLVGRIICVADAFDAMNSKRCYRDRHTREYIIQELSDNRSKQFDPDIVDCLLELIVEDQIRIAEA